MHGEYESLFGDIKESGIMPPEEDYETIRYDSDAGKFFAKFDGFEGWYDIVFCTVVGRGVDTYGTIDHLAFLIDLDD